MLDTAGRSLSFTTRQPPKVLRDFSDDLFWQMLQRMGHTLPEWQLATDPTATPATQDVLAQQFWAAFEQRLGSFGQFWARAAASMHDAVGCGLAGAYGLLGRCTQFELHLSSAAVDGEALRGINSIPWGPGVNSWAQQPAVPAGGG